jgi:hypothetical protein
VKTATIIALAVLAIGVYLEYTKDSSFGSIDMGSILIGGGAGALIAELV